jgi:hypothetical protein
MHCLIANKLGTEPRLVEVARKNLRRWWTAAGERRPHWMKEWDEILRQPCSDIQAILADPSERGAALRQSSPFAGVLSARERRRIYEAFRA